MAHDAHDTANTLQCFDGDLSHVDANGAFTYTSKIGSTMVMTKTGDIMKNWHKLLAQDPLIAARWSAQQVE